MAIWLPFKAPQNERNYTAPKQYNKSFNNYGRKRNDTIKCCLICGHSLNRSENKLCKSCSEYIRKELEQGAEERH